MKRLLFFSMIAAISFTACCKKTETYDFAGKTLLLTELAGEKYEPASTQRPVELKFMAKDNALAGNVGCNLISGSYYVNRDTLIFPQPMAMTRMLCDEVSNQVEMQMTELLINVNRYEVKDNSVLLYNGKELLGTFNIAECNADGRKCCEKASCEKTKCNADSVKCCKKDSTKCCKMQKEGCAAKKCDKSCAKKCDKPCKKTQCPNK